MNSDEYIQKLKNDIKEQMISEVRNEREKEYVNTVIDDYLIITPKYDTNGIVSIDMSSHYTDDIKGVSRKIKNVQFNLRKVATLAIESAISFKIPESYADYIRLAISAFLKAYYVASIDICNKDCLLLIYLHNKNAYDISIPEDEIINDIKKGMLELTEEEYHKSVNRLIKIASAIMVGGKVYLQERVVLKY